MDKNKKKTKPKEEPIEELIEEVVEEEKEEVNELEKLQQEALDWKDKYYRTLADTSNLKKRLEQEAIQSKKYQIQSFALNVLPVLDNLDRALSEPTTDEALHKGVEMVRTQLWQALQMEGVSEIEALDKPFDGNYHHAIMTDEDPKKENGIILEVLQKGYMLKDRILRAALVKVNEK